MNYCINDVYSFVLLHFLIGKILYLCKNYNYSCKHNNGDSNNNKTCTAVT